jgi:hypothetical protein
VADTDPAGQADEWAEYTPGRKYEIERVIDLWTVGAGRNRRWQARVKWEGYDETTKEPMGRVLKALRNYPGMLEEIGRMQEDYLAMHPGERMSEREELPAPERPEPTRLQPTRDRDRPRRFMFCLTHDEPQDAALINRGLRAACQATARHNRTLEVLASDFSALVVAKPLH